METKLKPPQVKSELHHSSRGADSDRINQDGDLSNDGSPQSISSKQSSRKRNRMPLSCTICRKRKVKCDRGRPHCNVCEKYKVAYLCAYQEPTWANSDGKNVKFDRQNELNNGKGSNSDSDGSITSLNGTPTNTSITESSLQAAQEPTTTSFTRRLSPTVSSSMKPTSHLGTSPQQSSTARDISLDGSDSKRRKTVNDQNPTTSSYQQYNRLATPLPYIGTFSAVNQLGSNERSSLGSYKPVDSNMRGGEYDGFSNNVSTLPPAVPSLNEHHHTSESHSQLNLQGHFQPQMKPQSQLPEQSQHQQHLDSRDQNQPVMTELQVLKEKIKQIEASIVVADLAQPRLNTMPLPRTSSQYQYRTPLPPIQSWSTANSPAAGNISQYSVLPLPGTGSLTAPSPNYSHQHQISTPSYSANINANAATNVGFIGVNSTDFRPLQTSAHTHDPSSVTNDGVATKPEDRTSWKPESATLITPTEVSPLSDEHEGTPRQRQRLVSDFLISPATQELYWDPNDKINFYEGYTPLHLRYCRINNYGPLAWVTLVRKDPFLKPLWSKVIELKKKQKPSELGAPSLPKSASRPEDAEFGARMYESEGLSDVQPYQQAKKDKNKDPDQAISQKELSFRMNKKDTDARTIVQIVDVLPPKKIIWHLVDRYFRFVYPFLPFLDEGMFVSDIEKIIGPRTLDSNEKVVQLRIEKRLDFASIGILLILMRFSYLSLLTNNSDDNASLPEKTAVEEMLLENPIAMEIIGVAQLCLNQFKLLRRCALNIFQCALLMKEYHKFAPEDGCDGFGDGDSQIFTGMLVQMGISIGLNRDPTSFELAGTVTPLGNLWRKIWFRLVTADNFQAFQFGNPKLIKEEFYDTQLPEFDPRTSNVKDLELEKTVINGICSKFEVEKLMTDVSDLVLNIRENSKMEDIINALAKLERYISSRYQGLRALMTPTDGNHLNNVKKVYAIIAYCESQSLIHPVFYHIFLFYQTKNNSEASNFFMCKVLKTVVDIIANFVHLVKYSYKYVGVGFDLVLTPALESAMHKTLQSQFSLFVRAVSFKGKLSKSGSETDLKLIDAVNRYLKSLLDNIENYLRGLTAISGKYFYAWRMSKAQNLILTLLKDNSESLVDLFDNQPNFFKYYEESDFEILTNFTRNKMGYERSGENERQHSNDSRLGKEENTGESTSAPGYKYQPNVDIDNFWLEQFYKASGENAGNQVNPPLHRQQKNMVQDRFSGSALSPSFDTNTIRNGMSNGKRDTEIGIAETPIAANSNNNALLSDPFYIQNDVDFDLLLSDGSIFTGDMFGSDAVFSASAD
ncbi:hypothetical protein CANARDRAFT_25897 [[Candida] arabinofermentans NRRL YB-2248]|uniref:Zn(2)-C6 fungal-type domain-containing protein n=1 Tax=[Candida] arabinofermentans NRRL YB-2248 TaxID=983967 RepID=A0A1E4T7F9_9ASCO|nr:hypothetical protein CANARDRAFT_25897 [[Candida] arabinofermentans NRRL YB-2248]